jgi:hypothetical protein
LKGGSPLKHAESCTKAHENWEKDMVKFEESFRPIAEHVKAGVENGNNSIHRRQASCFHPEP